MRCRSLFPSGCAAGRGIAVTLLINGTLMFLPATQASETDPQKATVWGLGVGITSSQKPYIDVDRDTSVLPLLHVENRYVKFFGTTLEAKLSVITLSETNTLHFGIVGRWDGAGYESDDSWMLEGMEKRKGGFWAGGKIEWQTSLLNMNADWTHDVSGNSKGQQLSLVLDRSWQIGDHLSITPRIGATWYDSKYVDYYYGIRSHEVRAGRPEYHGGAGIGAEAGLQSVYSFNTHHSLILDAQMSRFSSDVKDSPLVDRSSSHRLSLGYVYYF